MLGVPSLIDVQKTMTDAAAKFLEAFVDSFFEFVDQPLLPSQVPTYILYIRKCFFYNHVKTYI